MKFTDQLKELQRGGELNTCVNKGYVITPNIVRRCLRVSQEEKAVLYEIYSLYNEEKKCAYPTQQTLAMYVGITSSSISKHVKGLAEKGFIEVLGKKGQKKRYIPSSQLSGNPYIILSELFHFGVKTINSHLPEDIGGDWANKVLKLVNVRKNVEFTENDFYGRAVKEFDEFTFNEVDFLNGLLVKVEKLVGFPLSIEWAKEIENTKKSKKQKQTQTPAYVSSKKKTSLVTDHGADEEYLHQIGWG